MEDSMTLTWWSRPWYSSSLL